MPDLQCPRCGKPVNHPEGSPPGLIVCCPCGEWVQTPGGRPAAAGKPRAPRRHSASSQLSNAVRAVVWILCCLAALLAVTGWGSSPDRSAEARLETLRLEGRADEILAARLAIPANHLHNAVRSCASLLAVYVLAKSFDRVIELWEQ